MWCIGLGCVLVIGRSRESWLASHKQTHESLAEKIQPQLFQAFPGPWLPSESPVRQGNGGIFSAKSRNDFFLMVARSPKILGAPGGQGKTAITRWGAFFPSPPLSIGPLARSPILELPGTPGKSEKDGQEDQEQKP